MARFQDEWVARNLSRDAAHRREIAQLQQERRAASAGILPGSALYRVKRLAEAVDVLLTIGEDARIQKRIEQANTRLNEAAALLAQGEQATDTLEEYRQTVMDVATGSGSNPTVTALLKNEVVDSGMTSVTAVLPGDPGYALKEAVQRTIAALPSDVQKPDFKSEVLFDRLAAIKQNVAEGETGAAREQLEAIETIIDPDPNGERSIPREVLADVQLLRERVQTTDDQPLPEMFQKPEREPDQPRHPSRSWMALPMTDQQVTAKVQEIRGRVFVFGEKKSQLNTLKDQLLLLQNYADRGRILRELADVLPSNGLRQRVLGEMRRLNEQVVGEMQGEGE
jgi:hypothetical protein